MSDELLTRMFTCDRFRADFPRGMPVKACLRRQLDRQEGVKPGQLGPPRRPFCAGECRTGLVHRVAAEAVGVTLSSCPVCGSALIGLSPTDCATCAERRHDAGKFVPKGFNAAERAQVSTRIWEPGAVPDVAIAPASKAPAAAPAARSHRRDPEVEAWAGRQAPKHPMCRTTLEQDHPEEPAEPAEEETMARGKRDEPWPCCGSKSHRHLKGCESAGKGGKAATPPKPTARSERAAASREAAPRLVPAPARRPKAEPEGDFEYLSTETVDDLVTALTKIDATRAAVVAELRRRRSEVDQALARAGESEAA